MVRSYRLRLGLHALILGIIFVSLAASGCSGAKQHTYHMGAESDLPMFVLDKPDTYQQAYQFAMANPQELMKYPCYCGCGNMGHTSNLNCYVQAIEADGTLIFDNHGAYCQVCIDITQDVMRLMDRGWSAPQIRNYIDSNYSHFGPPTDTPFPLA